MAKQIKNVKVYTKSGAEVLISEDLKEHYLKKGFLAKPPKNDKKDK